MIRINVEKLRSIIFGAVRIAGPIATGVLAFKAGMKAKDAIEVDQYEYETDEVNEDGTPVTRLYNFDDLDRMDQFKIMAPIVLPAVSACAVTIACSVIDKKIDTKHLKQIATLYSASLLSGTMYKEKLEEVNPDAAAEVKKKVEEEKKKYLTSKDSEHDIVEHACIGSGDTIFHDPISGRSFLSTVDAVRKGLQETMDAYNKDSNQFGKFKSLELNYLYDHLGIATSWLGWEYGWYGECVDSSNGYGWEYNGENIYLSLTMNRDGSYNICYGDPDAVESGSMPFQGWYEL